RALARGITIAETGGAPARALLSAVYPATGRAHIIGITGAPGAGKSTLVNSLALHWRRAGKTIGVIAVDPTSPFSGGAILGDRIRMQPLGGDPGIFIRSMASRGRLGGIARATGDAIALLDAAGFDIVLIETVGAGQSEVEIAGAAQTTLVIEVPGMGDDVQSIKAGILEIADIFVVNKADREGADALIGQLRAMLRLGGPPPDGWEPPIVPAIAIRDQGIAEIAAEIERHRAHLGASGQQAMRDRDRAGREFQRIIQEAALEQLRARYAGAAWDALVDHIAARELDPYTAAAQLLEPGVSK
ncbi:MAG TPA: methylmalonyl Co-A mutase-associated GTPase MeaB, partial [Roseiflexaceae bacterium]